LRNLPTHNYKYPEPGEKLSIKRMGEHRETQREMTKNEKRRHIRKIEQNIADKREKTNKDKVGFKKSLPTYETLDKTLCKLLKFQNEYIFIEQTSGPL
jgi:hypothetical protein